MITYYTRHTTTDELKVSETPLQEHVWVYGSHVDSSELELLVENYGLEEAIVRDILDPHELPRVEFSHDTLYVFARAPHDATKSRIVSKPFLAILKHGVLLTLSRTNYETPEEVIGGSALTTRNLPLLLIGLLDHVVKEYGKRINETGNYTLSARQRLGAREIKNEDFIHFVTVESELREYQASLTSIKAVLERLRDNTHDFFSGKGLELLEDITLYIEQLLVAVSSFMQTIADIRSAYTTISNNTLNARMKTLTLITILIALPNVFYGMYGMNVSLPFQHQPWAYTAVTGFTIVIVLAVMLIVRRLRF